MGTNSSLTKQHVMDVRLQWCKACGRPYYELVESDLTECDGDPLKTHPRYWEALERAKAIFDPIVDKVMEAMPLPGERT